MFPKAQSNQLKRLGKSDSRRTAAATLGKDRASASALGPTDETLPFPEEEEGLVKERQSRAAEPPAHQNAAVSETTTVEPAIEPVPSWPREKLG